VDPSFGGDELEREAEPEGGTEEVAGREMREAAGCRRWRIFRHFPCKWKYASGKEKVARGAGAAESRLWEEGPARRAGDLLGVPNFSDGRRVGFGGKSTGCRFLRPTRSPRAHW
jgi:hypothetical protein